MRPAAHEWDEREETPWPIIQEAAKIGLYGFEALAQFFADPSRAAAADRQRGALLGRRRHRHGDHGHVAGRRRDLRPGHRRADRRVDPAAASAPSTTPKVAAFCASEPNAGSDVSAIRTTREASTRPPTSGSSTARRRGPPTAASPTCTSSSPRSTASSARAATPRSSSRPSTKGLEQGAKVKKHGLRASHTADVYLDDCRVPGALPARRQGEARRAPRPRARGHAAAAAQAAMQTFEATRPTVGAQAIGIARAAYEYALDYAQGARAVRHARSSRTRRSPSRWPT